MLLCSLTGSKGFCKRCWTRAEHGVLICTRAALPNRPGLSAILMTYVWPFLNHPTRNVLVILVQLLWLTEDRADRKGKCIPSGMVSHREQPIPLCPVVRHIHPCHRMSLCLGSGYSHSSHGWLGSGRCSRHTYKGKVRLRSLWVC